MNSPFSLVRFLAVAFFAVATLPLAAEDSALEIASGFERQKIDALQTYLSENPEADDRDLAYSILVEAHLNLGEQEPIPGLIMERYEHLDTGAEANLQVLANEIARPLVESAVVSGQRDKAKSFITRLKSDLEAHPQGDQFSQFLDQLASSLYLPGVGDTMDIAFTSLEGKEVDLSDMDDKVVLVDFWATWCRPCIAEMPNVVAAYEEYRDRGFEVVGISLDEDKEAVESFVEENQLPWPQYFDGKGWENEIAQRFGISSIPATFLVGKDGKVVASNLHGEDLAKAIESALQ